MRCTALWLALTLAALGLGCKLDTTPGDGDAVAIGDGAIGTDDGGPKTDTGTVGEDAGDGAAGAAGGEAASPCGSCPQDAPVCLSANGRCVECSSDRDCDDNPFRPVCDVERHACAQCNDDDDCGGDAPHCNAKTHVCVTCTADVDCTDPERPRCDLAALDCVRCTAATDCGGDTPACDIAAHECVACVVDADCTDPAHPQCESNACLSCSSDAACAGRENATLCDLALGSPTAGECVQCTVADESPCAGNACDPQTHRCTDRPLASKQICEPCVADSECVVDHRCIAMQFGAAVRENAYCMKQVSTGCERPYASAPIHRASRSGAAAEDYCGIDEQRVTCEAINGLIADVECAGGSDDACQREGSICRSVNGLADRCTYACEAAAQCPSAFACSSGYCGGAGDGG